MSGAAIWSVSHLVGVVFEHRPRDALNTLTGSRVDRWYTDLRHKQLKRLHDLIGLPLEDSRLVTVTPQVMRLYAYLDAGARMADEDPQGDLAGRPELSKIYTPQSIRQQGLQDLLDLHLSREVSPPDTILNLDGNVVVVAGPGGGKSSLLNWLMMASIDRWRVGNPKAEVPVVIQAADLADDTPLSAALAASVSRNLARFGLLNPLPAEFFQEPPRPTGRWLLLIDSLDEIIDAEMRRHVLRTLASVASTAHRFVICTRPLPGDELELLGGNLPRYELLPFSAAEVTELGEHWFTAVDAADPAKLARSFTSAIEQAEVSELARTPLMATMLCQLHMADQSISFLAGRSKIFEQFTALLSERFHSRGPGGIYAQVRAALERYGPGVVTKAEAAIARTPGILEELAARQNEDAGLTTREFITAHPGLGRPEPVTAPIWDEFVCDALRRTGLVTGPDLRFFHHTVMEYLSARHIAKDKVAYAAALHAGLRAVDRRFRATAHMSVPGAAPEASYLGFLLDAGEPPRAALKLLDGMAGSRDIQGCEFIADLTRLGTALPPDTLRKTSKALWKRLRRKWRYTTAEQSRAVTALAELDRERGTELMVEMSQNVKNPRMPERNANSEEKSLAGLFRHYEEIVRAYLALRLGERGDPRGPALLIAMAQDPGLTSMSRAHSGGGLADLRHPDAQHILRGLATDKTMTPTGRILAARLLGLKLHDRQAAGILVAMARDGRLRPDIRVRAAFSLARLQDNRGTVLLVNIARRPSRPGDPFLTVYSRIQAAKFLARLGDRRALDILKALSRDQDIEPLLRRRARAARRRFATMNSGLTVEQRVLQEHAQRGKIGQKLEIILVPIYQIFFPFFMRRYGHKIDAILGPDLQ